MNKNSFPGSPGAPAVLHYDLSDFKVITAGAFVICAVTGKQIPLEDLRYWNPERQEAYIDAPTATRREQQIADEDG